MAFLAFFDEAALRSCQLWRNERQEDHANEMKTKKSEIRTPTAYDPASKLR